ncbi:MAG: hypothetical protein RR839_02095 [Oscillospiraceae bacterium]
MKQFIAIALILTIISTFIGCNNDVKKVNAKDEHCMSKKISPSEESTSKQSAIEVPSSEQSATEVPSSEKSEIKKQKFTAKEIKKAIYVATVNFQEQKGCTLIKMVYDEEESDEFIKLYMESGHGANNGIKKENVIVLMCDFRVDDSEFHPDLKAGETCSNWKWILIRENSHSNWIVDEWGS